MKFMFWNVRKIKFIISSSIQLFADFGSILLVSCKWEGWLGCNTAVVVIVSTHLDVSSDSSSASPRVPYQVVVVASFASVSDSKDGVVETTGRTASAVVNSTSVSTEAALRGIDGNRYGSDIGKSVGQVVLASWLGIMVSGNSCNNVSLVELASSLVGWCMGKHSQIHHHRHLWGISMRIGTILLDIRSYRNVRNNPRFVVRTSWGDFVQGGLKIKFWSDNIKSFAENWKELAKYNDFGILR